MIGNSFVFESMRVIKEGKRVVRVRERWIVRGIVSKRTFKKKKNKGIAPLPY